jgi:hypothetical protein
MNSISGFQLYERDVKRIIDAISLTKSSQIGFPTSMYRERELSQYKGAYLYWNPDTEEVGIEFTNDSDRRVFNLIHSKKYGAYIGAGNFLAANKIDVKKYAGRYEYRMIPLRELGADKDGDMYVFHIVQRGEELLNESRTEDNGGGAT